MSTHDPANFTGPDQEKLEKAFFRASRGYGNKVVIDKPYTFGKTITVESFDPKYLCMDLSMVGFWARLTYTGTGPAFVFKNLKHSKFEGVGLRRVSKTIGDSTGIVFTTDGSSSHVTLERFQIGGFGTGLQFDAPNGADMSVYNLNDACTTECATGFRFTGSNALGFNLHACTASGSEVGFEFLGGSNSRLYGCGGSKTKTMFRVRGGFNMAFHDGETEDCGVVYEIGGESLDGVNNTGSILIDDIEHRGVSTCLLDAKKAGFTSVRVLSPTPQLCRLYNDKPVKPGVLHCSDNMTVEKSGSWVVNQGQSQVE